MKYPKGTRLLSEEERVKTLNSLIKAQYENSLLLEKMPITNRTMKLQPCVKIIADVLLG